MGNESVAVVESTRRGPGGSPVATSTWPWRARLSARLDGRGQGGLPAWTHRNSTWGCVLLLGLVGVSLAMPAAAADPAKFANARSQETPSGGATSPDSPSVELTFAVPKRFGIITEIERKRQRLYEVGDYIVHPADPSRTVKIQQIERERLGLKDSQTGRIVWVAVGEKVPGFPDRRFTSSATLAGVDYRYIATMASLDLEPRLLNIHGGRAILEVDIRPPEPLVAAPPTRRGSPSGAPSTVNAVNALDRKPDVTPFDQVRVSEPTPDTYDLSKAEMRDALDHGGRLLAQQWPSIQPLLSIQDGIGLQVKSPIADGVLTSPGFQVTNPNLAGRFGIKAGDVIVAINDQSVTSFRDLYNLYQQAENNPLLSQVQVKLERRGVPVTKTYRLR